MRAASSGLISHIGGATTTLATCWRVTRRDGEVFRFTDHTADLTIDAQTYAAATGYQRDAIASNAALSVDNTDLTFLLDSAAITVADLRRGLWDYALVEIFVVNYADLGQGSMAERRGRLGVVTVTDTGSARAEIRGLMDALQQPLGEVYQPECRADLGDARCQINLAFGAGWTQAATVDSSASRSSLVVQSGDLAAYASGWFNGGVVVFQSGDNAGVAREVLSWDLATRTVVLFEAAPYTIEAGDTLHISPGCDKRKATCQTKFNNYLNFRGEPFVPGVDQATARPT